MTLTFEFWYLFPVAIFIATVAMVSLSTHPWAESVSGKEKYSKKAWRC